MGLVDNWLRHVADVKHKHAGSLEGISDPLERHARLCELNVIEQAVNVCQTTVVMDAWERGQPLSVHAWIYGLHDGRVRDLGLHVANSGQIAAALTTAVARISDAAARPSVFDNVPRS
jgi:carbonic anhydrase